MAYYIELDDFAGTVLDTVKWSTSVNDGGTVTVNEKLELNIPSNATQMGAYCYSNDTFPKAENIIINFRWKPGTNHYASALPPHVCICDPASSRGSQYGNRNQKAILIQLANSTDYQNRTWIRLRAIGSSISDDGTIINSQAIDIDEGVFHDVIISIDGATRTVTIDIDDGTYNFSGVIPQTEWDTLPADVVFEMGNSNYSYPFTEEFDDVSAREDIEELQMAGSFGITAASMTMFKGFTMNGLFGLTNGDINIHSIRNTLTGKFGLTGVIKAANTLVPALNGKFGLTGNIALDSPRALALAGRFGLTGNINIEKIIGNSIQGKFGLTNSHIVMFSERQNVYLSGRFGLTGNIAIRTEGSAGVPGIPCEIPSYYSQGRWS